MCENTSGYINIENILLHNIGVWIGPKNPVSVGL